MDFEAALAAYLAQTNKTASVRAITALSWQRFAVYCRSVGLQLGHLAPCDLDLFQQALQWEPSATGRLYSSNTVDMFLRRTREVLRWMARTGHLSRDPSCQLVLPRPVQPQARILAWSEVQAILQASDRAKAKGLRDAALLNLLVESDMEVKSCLALQVGDVPKLPLENATRDLLGAYQTQVRAHWLRSETASKWLFLNHLGARLGPQTVSNALEEAARLAAVEGTVTVKCLRRSYRAGLARQAQSRLSLLTDPLTE